MGLAPLGNCKEKLKSKKNLSWSFREIIVKRKVLNMKSTRIGLLSLWEDSWLSHKFYRTFGKKRKVNGNISQHYKNIASALQTRIEEIVISQLKYLKKIYKVDKLCIAGGVGLNCSLNGKIQEKNIFKKIFIVPASGDSGVSFGASLASYFKRKKKNYINRNFYLGSRYNDREIKKELYKNKNKLNYGHSCNISKNTQKSCPKKNFRVVSGSCRVWTKTLETEVFYANHFLKKWKIIGKCKVQRKFKTLCTGDLNDRQKNF